MLFHFICHSVCTFVKRVVSTWLNWFFEIVFTRYFKYNFEFSVLSFWRFDIPRKLGKFWVRLPYWKLYYWSQMNSLTYKHKNGINDFYLFIRSRSLWMLILYIFVFKHRLLFQLDLIYYWHIIIGNITMKIGGFIVSCIVVMFIPFTSLD